MGSNASRSRRQHSSDFCHLSSVSEFGGPVTPPPLCFNIVLGAIWTKLGAFGGNRAKCLLRTSDTKHSRPVAFGSRCTSATFNSESERSSGDVMGTMTMGSCGNLSAYQSLHFWPVREVCASGSVSGCEIVTRVCIDIFYVGLRMLALNRGLSH